MPRRLPSPRHLLLTLSLLLTLTSATLWLRSLWYNTNLTWYQIPLFADSAANSTEFELNNGLLHLRTVRYNFSGPLDDRLHFSNIPFSQAHVTQSRSPWQWTPGPRGRAFAGFAHTASRGPIRHSETTIPLYLPTLLFAIHPALHLRSHLRRRHRAIHNLCPSCGYD